ncbi:HNH endonuclease [Algibacter sp. 2305UL17-15]|uniref:HNH endonuclease n=1 Tax=Algibacter sp. 2305UL17-15 TaxID=3231268 RepID=UPI00345AEC17
MENELIPFIDNLDTLVNEFNELYQDRLLKKQKSKNTDRKRTALNIKQRKIVFCKTEGLCHICGCELNINKFEADHVKPHSQGGNEITDNFLPSCSKCNNYRWNYSPEEIQWILKLGVWLKTKIQERDNIGLRTASEFLLDEVKRENRRNLPRKPKVKLETNINNLFPIKGRHKYGFLEPTFEEIEKAKQIIAKFQLKINYSDIRIVNKTFLITGESNIARKNIESFILKKDGLIKKTVSQKLDYLVIGNFYGLMKVYQVEKLNENKNANIKIITQSEFTKAVCCV